MSLRSFYTHFSACVIMAMSGSVIADTSNDKGIDQAINQHDKNIERFSSKHPDKAVPRGLVHSREVLNRIKASERPSKPELPDVAMRPERPAIASRPAKPEKPGHPRK
ncbi:MAG: hypothetical protein OEY52_13465 [Gammaproteobacteria bacterium]|nr:hypothetical protein [Gammaproteobacteria bacterium]